LKNGFGDQTNGDLTAASIYAHNTLKNISLPAMRSATTSSAGPTFDGFVRIDGLAAAAAFGIARGISRADGS